MSLNLERMLKAAGQNVPGAKPVLEVNPHHPLVRRLQGEASDQRFGDWSQVLFDQSLLAEGGQLDDPGAFVKRLNELMVEMTTPSPHPSPAGGEGASKL
jgi:molecular chaperone HtpG